MDFHPISNMFPMMGADAFKALKESISERGQRLPVYTYQKQIIDGRNRYNACVELGIKPVFEEWNGVGLLADFVWDLNAERRDLTFEQKVIAAGKYAMERKKEAEQRRLSNLRRGESPSVSVDTLGDSKDLGYSRQKAAKAFGIGEATVGRSMKVFKDGAPELIQAVESGQASVAAAAVVATLPVEKQKAIVALGTNEIVKAAKDIHGYKLPEEKDGDGEIKLQGVGVFRAHEAINCLKRIPKNDALRKEGFKIVTDWIRHNQ